MNVNGEDFNFEGRTEVKVRVGSQLRVFCVNSERLTVVYCEENGLWGEVIPTCDDEDRSDQVETGSEVEEQKVEIVCLLEKVQNGHFIVNGSEIMTNEDYIQYPLGTSAVLVCNKGYVLVEEPLKNEKIDFFGSKCGESGMWAPGFGRCVVRTTEAPTTSTTVLWSMSPEEQADVDRKLLSAAEQGDYAMVEKLLEVGANANVKDDSYNGYTPLIYSILSGFNQSVSVLLRHGANTEVRSNSGMTPLIWAAYVGRDDMVMQMLESGAEIEARDENNATALMYAARFGHCYTVELLLADGAKVDDIHTSGYTSLILAAKNGHVACVKSLLRNGANVNAHETTHGGSSLMWASYNGHVSIVEMLMDHGANLNYVAESGIWKGSNALMLAAENVVSILQYSIILEKLTTTSLPVNEESEESDEDLELRRIEHSRIDALIKASANDQLETVRALIDAGVKVDSKDANGYTAVMAASANGNLFVLRFLLNRGASADAVDVAGYSALTWAGVNGHANVAWLLLQFQSLPIDHRETPNGGTALSWAAYNGHNDVVSILLAYGADIDARAPVGSIWAGHTPLMLAAMNNEFDTVTLLLDNGASRSGCFYRLCLL